MAVQETTYATIITESMKGYMAITLDEWTTTVEPVLKEGGRFELSGSLFKITSDEDIDPDNNFAGFANSTQIYGYFVEAAGVTKSVLTTTSPTWSEQKQAYYDATETYRYWGGIYKDSGGNYADKFIYNGRSLKHSYNFIIDDRGNLDMDGNISLVGSANADKQIDFASDATQLWDESEDYFNWNKSIHSSIGRVPTGYGSLTNPTENTIFDALDSYVPNVGDRKIFFGTAVAYTTAANAYLWHCDFNRIYRLDANNIQLFGTEASRTFIGGSFSNANFQLLTETALNGSTSAFPNIVAGTGNIYFSYSF